jgi:hypothetical protein
VVNLSFLNPGETVTNVPIKTTVPVWTVRPISQIATIQGPIAVETPEMSNAFPPATNIPPPVDFVAPTTGSTPFSGISGILGVVGHGLNTILNGSPELASGTEVPINAPTTDPNQVTSMFVLLAAVGIIAWLVLR